MNRRLLRTLVKCVACVVAIASAGATEPSLALRGAQRLELTRADFGEFKASREARRLADWVLRTEDHRGAPFLIIDKVAANAFLFDASRRVRAAAPVLLGIAKGDSFEPGSAEKNMYDTQLEERITPAGRFTPEPGIDDKGKHVLWIHYDAGIALHAVLDNPGERRRERLASPSPDDNRISYGCVNVPTEFYEDAVRPAFERRNGIVYVLPETQSVTALIGESAGKQQVVVRAGEK